MLVDDGHRLLGQPDALFGRLGVRAFSVRSSRNPRKGIAEPTARERLRVALGEIAGILPLRESRHRHLHRVRLLPLVEARRRALAGGVGVERQHDLARVPLQQPDVFLRERRATGGHRTRHAGTVESDHVGVALADHDLVVLGDVGLRPVQPVEDLRLGVDRRLRGVLVLRRIVGSGQDPTAERQRLARLGEDREHHPRPERVLHLVALVPERQPDRLQDVGRRAQPPRERIPVVGRPTELELASDVAGEATPAEIVTSGPGVGVVQQALVIPLDGLVHRFDELLAPRSFLRLARRGVVELDAGLGRQVLDRPGEVEVLDLLDEREDVAALVAPEALVATGLLADVERPALLGVERAQPDPVAPDPLQRDVLLDRVDDRHRRPQPLDVLVDDPHGRSA